MSQNSCRFQGRFSLSFEYILGAIIYFSSSACLSSLIILSWVSRNFTSGPISSILNFIRSLQMLSFIQLVTSFCSSSLLLTQMSKVSSLYRLHRMVSKIFEIAKDSKMHNLNINHAQPLLSLFI